MAVSTLPTAYLSSWSNSTHNYDSQVQAGPSPCHLRKCAISRSYATRLSVIASTSWCPSHGPFKLICPIACSYERQSHFGLGKSAIRQIRRMHASMNGMVRATSTSGSSMWSADAAPMLLLLHFQQQILYTTSSPMTLVTPCLSSQEYCTPSRMFSLDWFFTFRRMTTRLS